MILRIKTTVEGEGFYREKENDGRSGMFLFRATLSDRL
jgi:hypothetical protein